jgi:hypothetical protein
MMGKTGRLAILLICAMPVRANVVLPDNLLSTLWPPGNADALWFSDLALANNPDPTRPSLLLVTEGDAPVAVTLGEGGSEEFPGDPAELFAAVAGVSQIGYLRDGSANEGGFFSNLNADPPIVTLGIVGVIALAAAGALFRRRRPI